MKKQGHITIISCGIGNVKLLQVYNDLILKSDILAGGQRLLDNFKDYQGERIVFNAKTVELAKNLAELAKFKNIVILASGDALFHGIGKTIKKYLHAEQITIIPGITAMQSLFSKLQISWDSVSFFSVHGKNITMPPFNFLSNNLSIIYCDYKLTAANIAKKLITRTKNCETRNAVIAENIGLDNEKITNGNLAKLASLECSHLSILLILPENENIVKDDGIALGLSDNAFCHQNRLITHSEIRAVILSKLRLGHGVMWDLGAGSGSVGIEAGCLCKDLKVYSVEQAKIRYDDILQNCKNFGCQNVEVYNNDILDVIDTLPSPRSVFIGGGGKDLSEILTKSYDKLCEGGKIVVSAVLLETKAILINLLPEKNIEVVSVSISSSKNLKGKRLMKSENTVELYVYSK